MMMSSLLSKVVSGVLLFLLALSSCYLLAQPNDSSDQSFLLNSNEWSELDVEIYSWWIEKDAEGFIWFNSSEGLCRFDGEKFYYFKHDPAVKASIPNDFITVITFHEPGKAYIGFRELGLIEYDLTSERVICHYTTNSLDENSLSSAFVSSLLLDSSYDLWVITDDHVLQLLNSESGLFERFHIPIPEKYISEGGGPSPGRIIEDVSDSNSLWIGSRFGLYRFDKTSRKFILFPIDKYVRSYRFQFPTPLLQTEDGLIWFGHFRNEGVKVFDPKSESWIVKMPTGDVSSSFVFDIKPYGDSLILATLRPDHLMIMDRFNPGAFKIIEGSEKITKYSCLAVDDQMNLYSTSPTAKLTKLSRRWSKFPFIDVSSFFDENAVPWCMNFDNSRNNYVISPRFGGEFVICDQDFKLIKRVSFDEDEKLNVNDLLSQGDMIYILTTKGLFSYNNKKGLVEHLESESHESYETAVIHENDIWMSRGSNLVAYDLFNAKSMVYPLPRFGGAEVKINDIEYVGNRQLMISTSEGLHLFDLVSRSFVNIQSTISGIELGEIKQCNSILLDPAHESIWVSTKTRGLLQLSRLDTTTFAPYFYWHPLSVLTNVHNSATFIGEEIWTSTPSGFTVFDPSQDDFISFQKTDGVLRGLRKSVIYPGAEGNFYAPYSTGFYQINPSEIKTEKIHPYLISMQVNGSKLYDSTFVFDHDENNFRFEIGAKNFGVAGGSYYRYRLLGYDEEWKFLDRDHSVNVANLSAGNYEIQYDARSLHTFWNKIPASLEFSIRPPPLLTWWFKIIWFFLFCGLLYLYYNWTQRRRSEKQRVLNLEKQRVEAELKALKAQMNPHFLFNTLNSINWYIIKEKSAEASKYLTKFSKLMRLILDNSKQERITLAKEIETLKLYTALEQVRCDEHFKFEITIDKNINLENVVMPPLIFQPFFENAIWHGLIHKPEKGKLTLLIEKEHQYLKCTIQDDGIGREAAQKIKDKTQNYGKSSGIAITTQRLKGIELAPPEPLQIFDLIASDGESEGTRVEILIPILLKPNE